MKNSKDFFPDISAEKLTLSAEDFDKLIEACEAEGKPSKKLVEAAKRAREEGFYNSKQSEE